MTRRSPALVFTICLVSLAIPLTTHAQPSPWQIINELRPGEWYEVPNSKLSESGIFPPPDVPLGNGPENVMAAWSGGAYDTMRDRLIIWGGGHNNYGGNELYAFTLSTLKWTRIWGPSPNIQPVAGPCHETNLDGNPAARETYDGLLYLPALDKFWGAGGSLWCGSGGGSRASWIFDFAASQWERKADWPGNGVSQVSAVDPVTGRIVAVSDWPQLGEYDPSTNSWTDRGYLSVGEEQVGEIDPDRRLFVIVGNGRVTAVNLQNWQQSRPNTTGGSVVVNARGPAFAYDPVIKKFVGWTGGTSVYSLDPTTWSWTEHAAAPTNTVMPTPPTRVGVYGRFQYVPSLNAYMVVNRVGENVFVYKLSSGGAQSTSVLTLIGALPNGRTGVPYSATLSATGGTLPYSWVVFSGGLPVGLILDSASGVISGTPSSSGTSSFTVQVADAAGATADKTFSVVVNPNAPPNSPGVLSGPGSGSPGVSYTFSTSATDPEGDRVQYTFDWGDGTTTTTSLANSGAVVSATHSWAAADSYSVRAVATDALGANSGWSSPLTVAIAPQPNAPPSVPTAASGPTSGVISVNYSYSTSSSDPEGHQIRYTFDWGDGTTTTTSLVASGTSINASHSWTAAGSYAVRVMATDALGASSGWSSPLTVVIMTGTTTTRYEASNSLTTYVGAWSGRSDSRASGGGYRSSSDSTTPASATLTFTGVGVSWISNVGSFLGIARVYLDGVLDATVDLYSSTRKFQQKVYTETGLAPGTHTLRIVVTGTRNPSSSGRRIDVDAFDVLR